MATFFAVKNFEKFQHYRDRNPPWIKLYQSVLADYAFTRLQDASKMHLLAIWLLASRYSNKIPWDEKWISTQISATSKVDLDALESAGFISKINDASIMLAERLQDARPERERERETETEREEKVLLSAEAPTTALNGNGHDDLGQAFDAWNAFAASHGLPTCAKRTKARASAVRARLKDAGGIEGFKAALVKAAAIPWMLGQNERGWRLNIDTLNRESFFARLMEGAYNRASTAEAAQSLFEKWEAEDGRSRQN